MKLELFTSIISLCRCLHAKIPFKYKQNIFWVPKSNEQDRKSEKNVFSKLCLKVKSVNDSRLCGWRPWAGSITTRTLEGRLAEPAKEFFEIPTTKLIDRLWLESFPKLEGDNSGKKATPIPVGLQQNYKIQIFRFILAFSSKKLLPSAPNKIIFCSFKAHVTFWHRQVFSTLTTVNRTSVGSPFV